MADRRTSEYPAQRFQHRPTMVAGIFYDGTVSCAKAIVAWARAGTGSTLFDVLDGELHMYTRQGARYVPENDLAVIGVVGEPYSIQPEVLALAYKPAGSGTLAAPLPPDRVAELVAESRITPDRDRLREIIRQLAASCEAMSS